MLVEPKIVRKPWGREEWLSDGKRMPYALKLITFNAGHRSSLQVHKQKKETNYVLDGTGTLLIGRSVFNIDAYLLGTMSGDTLTWHTEDLEVVELRPGSVFDVLPGHIHRVVAETDLTFVEASTPELDDVIRLQDDASRGHGRIESEHA